MRLRIRQRDLDLAPDVRAQVERRVRLAVGRHGAGVSQAEILLCPSPTAGCHCQIDLQLEDGDTVRVEDRGETAQAATTSAAWRLQRRLTLRLDTVDVFPRSAGGRDGRLPN